MSTKNCEDISKRIVDDFLAKGLIQATATDDLHLRLSKGTLLVDEWLSLVSPESEGSK